MKKKGFKMGLLLGLSVLLSGCSLEGQAAQTEDPGEFTLSFITIGKGDAFLLTAPDSSHYLLDTGKAKDYPQIEQVLRLKGVEKLDGIFLTHGHKDHAGGLEEILKNFPVETVYISGVDTVSYKKRDVRSSAEKYGAAVHELKCGETFQMGTVQIQCWMPDTPIWDNENNNSVIMRIVHGENAFLMMGDAESGEEAAFCSSGMKKSARVLKLGHHGERDATSMAFLQKVKPEYGLITGNEEENPDSVNEVISERLEIVQAEAVYSQCDGLALDFCSDGHEITIKTVKDTEK